MKFFNLENIIMMASTNSPFITDVDWCISMTELFGGVGNMNIDSPAERIVSHKIIFEFINEIAYCDSLDIVADLMEGQFKLLYDEYYIETVYYNKYGEVKTYYSNNYTFGEMTTRFIMDCYDQAALRARCRNKLMEINYQKSLNQIHEDFTAFDIDSLEPPAPEDDEYNRDEGFPPDDYMVFSESPDDDYLPIEAYETPTNEDNFTMNEESDNAIENDSNLNIPEEEDVLRVLQESRVVKYLDFLKKEGYVNDLGVPCKYKHKGKRNAFWFLICVQLSIPDEWTILAKLTNENPKSIESLYYKFRGKAKEYELLVEEFNELYNKYMNKK